MPALIRLRDWEVRLDAYLTAAALQKVVWGTHDCVLFALGGAQALTGVDAAEDLRGTYSNARGALRRMRELFGAAGLEAAAEGFRARWGGEEAPVKSAHRGDIVLADVPVLYAASPQPALGLVSLNGRECFFVLERGRGFLRVPLRDCRKAWRVG